MRMALFGGMAFLLVGWNARANDEYVNPTFCYRILLPDASSNVVANRDGSGVAMDVGGPCQGDACVHVAISAAYLKGEGDTNLVHQDYLGHGWMLKSTLQKRVHGTTWTGHVMSRNGAMMAIFENANPHDQARYAVVAQYPKAMAMTAQKAIDEVLVSWRWVSDCL